MSQENVEIVNAFAAWNEGRMDDLRDLFDPGVMVVRVLAAEHGMAATLKVVDDLDDEQARNPVRAAHRLRRGWPAAGPAAAVPSVSCTCTASAS